MLKGIWGKKIGMTQIFSENNKVVPVTVIDIDHWVVTNHKFKERDGYDAVQVGSLRKKYCGKDFSQEWLKNTKKYFSVLREITLGDASQKFEIGPLDFSSIVSVGEAVDVFGITKGHGFQGVVKRHGFTGGRASHGPRFGRIPGSLSFMRSEGKVIKGKKLPGHMGVDQRVMRNLEIIKIEPESNVVLVKGSVPGGSGSLVFIRKA